MTKNECCSTLSRVKKTNFPYESAHFATISQIRTKSKNC